MAGYTRSALILTLAAAAGLASLLGCHMPPPVYVVEAAPQQQPVPVRPPEVQQELRPPCPEDGWAWIAGFWHWDGDEYQWVEGEWVAPREGYSYYSANYIFINNQWMYQAAYWYPSHMPHARRHHGQGGHGHGGQGHGGNKGKKGGGTQVGKNTTGDPNTPSKLRVSAPSADKGTSSKVRVTAPPASGGVDPDKRQGTPGGVPGKAGGAWNKNKRKGGPLPAQAKGAGGGARKRPGQDKHLPAYDEASERRRVEPSGTGAGRVKVLKGHTDYRGTRRGRMIFSNIPDGRKGREGHGYPTDHTGAIILVPDKEKGSAWKSAARVAPRGHRPDPSVVEVHTGDPNIKIRVRRSRPDSEQRGEAEAREKKPARSRTVVDTRQRTHYKQPGQGQGERQPRTDNRRRVYQPQYVPSYTNRPRPRRVHQPRPRPRRNVQRPQPRPRQVVHRPRPRPPRVVHRPAPQPRRVNRPAPRHQPRRHVAPPKKRERRPPPPPPPPREKPRKRKRR